MKKIISTLFMTTLLVCGCHNNANQTSDANGQTDSLQVDEPQTDKVVEAAVSEAKDIVIKDNSNWHNGIEFYSVKINGDVLAFSGGTLHEGGYCFGLKPKGDGKYEIVPVAWNDDPELQADPQIATSDFSKEDIPQLVAEAKNIAGTDCIIIRHKKDGVISVFLATDKELDGLYEAEVRAMAQRIAGDYRDKDGKAYAFNPDMTYVFDGKNGKYKFEESYDCPDFIVTLADGQHFIAEGDAEGLTLTPSAFDEESGAWDKTNGKPLRLTLVPETASDWRYPFASKKLLTSGDVVLFSKKELRVMRNEIWARHGYNFKSDDLKKRFAKVKAYKPIDDNNNVKLSDIEAINSELILHQEKISDNEE